MTSATRLHPDFGAQEAIERLAGLIAPRDGGGG